MDELFFITLERLGLTGAQARVSVGWKEICAVVERSLSIGIQIRQSWWNFKDDLTIFLFCDRVLLYGVTHMRKF